MTVNKKSGEGGGQETPPGITPGGSTDKDDDEDTIDEVDVPLTEVPDVENPFADVGESDWFYGDVMYIYGKGLMNGTAPDMFSPDTNLSRAMIVTILWRLEGSPDYQEAPKAALSPILKPAQPGRRRPLCSTGS